MHATDPDGKPITYKIVGGADASQFKIDPTSDVLSFKSHPHDGKTYSLTVAAFDGPPGSAGSLSDVQTLTVKVANGLMNGSATSNDTFDLGHKFGVELVTNFDPRHDSITFDKTLFANTTDVLAHAQEVVLFSQHETTIAYDAPKGQPPEHDIVVLVGVAKRPKISPRRFSLCLTSRSRRARANEAAQTRYNGPQF